jgi:hypothetical protein
VASFRCAGVGEGRRPIRYTQNKDADIIVLSLDGKAYGYFEIDAKEKPTDEDRADYPPVTGRASRECRISTHLRRSGIIGRKQMRKLLLATAMSLACISPASADSHADICARLQKNLDDCILMHDQMKESDYKVLEYEGHEDAELKTL